MMAKKEKVFASPKEIIKAYFPTQADKKPTGHREGYGSEAELIVEELAAEFGTDLRSSLRR